MHFYKKASIVFHELNNKYNFYPTQLSFTIQTIPAFVKFHVFQRLKFFISQE
jgi:hypothetical protein